jgi:hypothetical protein
MNIQPEPFQTSVGFAGHLLRNYPSLLLKLSADKKRLNADLLEFIKSWLQAKSIILP